MANQPLTPERITALLAGSRNRGGHVAYIARFVTSDEFAWNVADAMEYAAKSELQLKTSVKQGLYVAISKREDKDNLKVIWDEDNKQLLIVNRAAVAAEVA